MTRHFHDGPVAGPSSRPWVSDPRQAPEDAQGGTGWVSLEQMEKHTDGLRRRKARPVRRQEGASSPVPEPVPESSLTPTPSATIPLDQPAPAESPITSSYQTASEGVPSSDISASSSFPQPASESSTRPPLFSGTRSETFASQSPSPTWSEPASSYSASSLPWSTRERHSSAAAAPTFVPGVELNMTLGGDSDTESVYAIAVELGHSASSSRKRAPGDGSSQTMNIQIDLGSSDMWLASGSCTSDSCSKSDMLFDDSQSLDSGEEVSIKYQSGSVSGDIFWEQLTLDTFQIGYQAFISADTVTNQDLENGDFSGVLGLAFPAASEIQKTIPGTTSSNPDGATFLDNLFGSGAYAPTNRLFSMALARREDVRTGSLFTIGQTNDRLCPVPCSPNYIPIIPQSRLGSTGFVHWRIELTGVSATTWSDPENGAGPTTTNIPLGPSFAESSSSSPLAVLDSGGVQILVSRRGYADSIYSAFGVTASSDGLYRMPCKTQLALTFEFSGSKVPLHPLDMSYPDPSDPSQATCIGMIQYADNLGSDVGDFILGSSFLKNVYSIYQYPDQVRSTRWQPTIGLIPLTNASVASSDFYAVRTNRQSLRSVSSDEANTSGPGPWNPTTSPATDGGSSGGKKVASTAVIIGCSVVGFFVLAAAAFAAWWFWLRRRHGTAGVVDYDRKSRSDVHSTLDSDYSGSTSRARKHQGAARQKSLIEGYSDFEGDSSWVSEGGDSIRLGHIPEVAEDDEDEGKARPSADTGPSSSARALNNPSLIDEPIALAPAIDERDRSPPPSGRRESSPYTRLSLAHRSRPSYGQSGPYPSLPKSATARSLGVSMSGPFPSNNNPAGQANRRPDVSPMYDINTSDYFNVPNRGRSSQRGGSQEDRDRTPSGPGALKQANPFDTP